MITLITGIVLFGSIAWLWRNKWAQKRIHGFMAFLYGVGAWFCSFWIGVWIQLNLLQAGTLGDVIRPLINLSLGVGFVCYLILRKKDEENKEVHESGEERNINPTT